MTAAYIRNNTPSAFTIPLHLGRATDRTQITLARGHNEIDASVIPKLAGVKDSNGDWKKGTASAYFNARKLQVAPPPVEGDPCNVVEVKPGVTVSHQARKHHQREQREEAAHAQLLTQGTVIAQLQMQLAKLTAEAVPAAETDHLLDPRSMNLDDLESEIEGLDGAELADVLSLEYKRTGGARKGAVELLTGAMRA